VKLWAKERVLSNGSADCLATIEFEDSVAALDFCPVVGASGSYMIAVGLENGRIQIFHGSLESSSWQEHIKIDAR
jgi:hypothetical protein